MIVLWTLALMAVGCNESKKVAEEQKQEEASAQQTLAMAEEPIPVSEVELALNENIENKGTLVLISTDLGRIKVKLYDETPQHRDNFIKLIKEGFYKDLLFHRVIKNFMIQGGDPNSRGAAPGVPLGNGGPGYTIPAEIVSGKFHKKGALAAARLGDQMNPQRASSGSQFYLVQGSIIPENQIPYFENNLRIKFTPEQIQAYTTIGGTPHLDGQYTVFGEVIEGLDIIDKIAAVATAQPGDRPIQDVKMDISITKK